jgi:hypothetical protein
VVPVFTQALSTPNAVGEHTNNPHATQNGQLHRWYLIDRLFFVFRQRASNEGLMAIQLIAHRNAPTKMHVARTPHVRAELFLFLYPPIAGKTDHPFLRNSTPILRQLWLRQRSGSLSWTNVGCRLVGTWFRT